MPALQFRSVTFVVFPGGWMTREQFLDYMQRTDGDYGRLVHETDILLYGILTRLGLSAAQSPLHDADTLTESEWATRTIKDVYDARTGQLVTDFESRADQDPDIAALDDFQVLFKKPHWHVIAENAGKFTLKQLEEYFQPLGVHYFRKTISKEGAVRYLCHLDSPDKATYDVHNVKLYGGFDGSALEKENIIGSLRTVSEIEHLIKELGIETYRDLADFADEYGDVRLQRSLLKFGMHWRQYLRTGPTDNSHWRKHEMVEFMDQNVEDNEKALKEFWAGLGRPYFSERVA